MADFTALYDSCVLYPAPLRDLLMWLALTDLFNAKWTDEIHDEWIRNVLADRPDLKPEQLERTRQLMNYVAISVMWRRLHSLAEITASTNSYAT